MFRTGIAVIWFAWAVPLLIRALRGWQLYRRIRTCDWVRDLPPVPNIEPVVRHPLLFGPRGLKPWPTPIRLYRNALTLVSVAVPFNIYCALTWAGFDFGMPIKPGWANVWLAGSLLAGWGGGLVGYVRSVHLERWLKTVAQQPKPPGAVCKSCGMLLLGKLICPHCGSLGRIAPGGGLCTSCGMPLLGRAICPDCGFRNRGADGRSIRRTPGA